MASAQTDREMMEKMSGERLFAYIAMQNFDGMVEMLSESKIGLEYLDENANTPFLFACYLGRFLFVKFLASRGANIKRINVFGQNALAMAAFSGDRSTCDFLLSLCPIEAYNESSICSPLSVAVITENVEFVKYFARLECNGFSSQNECKSCSLHGVCPLKLAMLQRHKQIIDVLRPMHGCHIAY